MGFAACRFAMNMIFSDILTASIVDLSEGDAQDRQRACTRASPARAIFRLHQKYPVTKYISSDYVQIDMIEVRAAVTKLPVSLYHFCLLCQCPPHQRRRAEQRNLTDIGRLKKRGCRRMTAICRSAQATPPEVDILVLVSRRSLFRSRLSWHKQHDYRCAYQARAGA